MFIHFELGVLNYELCAIEFSFKHVAFFISAYLEQKEESLLVNNTVMFLPHRQRYFRNV